MKLIKPAMEYKSQFLRFYEDLLDHDPDNADFYSEADRCFSRYLKRLEDDEAGLYLRPQHVPCSHRWLMDDEGTIVGVIRIRHNLDSEILREVCGHIGYDIAPSWRGRGYGKTMLKLALPIAHSLNLTKVLISADEDNTASRKVIEANGGELENIIYAQEYQRYIARYWVAVS